MLKEIRIWDLLWLITTRCSWHLHNLYINKPLTTFLEEIDGVRTTWAAEYLFQGRHTSDTKKQPEVKAIIFHRNVAKLLFISNRAQRYLQTPVTFLSTQVKRTRWRCLGSALEGSKINQCNKALTLKTNLRWDRSH